MSFLSIKRPLGRPNCFHSARNAPSGLKISTRLLDRSATNMRPAESIATEWLTPNSPGPEPRLPHAVMNLPSGVNLTIRALVLPPCPSLTMMSPLRATATSVGALNISGPTPATPGLPSVSETLPSGLNLMTTWPLPLPAVLSVAHTLPWRSTWNPWGWLKRPWPKLATSFPEASNLSIGLSVELTQSLAPQRSNTQTLLPSGSISTPVTCPNLRPSGIFNQSASRRYGLGAPFGSADTCAKDTAPSPAVAAAVIPNSSAVLVIRNMGNSSCWLQHSSW